VLEIIVHFYRCFDVRRYGKRVDVTKFSTRGGCHDRKLRKRKAVNILFLATAVKLRAATSRRDDLPTSLRHEFALSATLDSANVENEHISYWIEFSTNRSSFSGNI
jgi:hypothetical protein